MEEVETQNQDFSKFSHIQILDGNEETCMKSLIQKDVII
jgi:hypothetical protein